MYDPISVETALVSSGGDLLIQLSDGNVVNAGRVRGNPGPQGEKGEQGVRGAHGKDGIDGTNGAKWHTGVGAPELSVGENGDMYMDVAATVLPIYQKVDGNWLFLANLKATPAVGGGGSTAAGGGGAVILYPMPDGGQPPSVDNNGNSISKGDIWLDLNTGWLWVYDGTTWVPVADRPPVIISPTPPDHNNASNEDPTKPPQYTVKDGDLWLDPSTNQLYIYRDGAWSEITACTTSGNETGPIDFPIGTDFPANGDQIPDGHQHDNFYWDATLGAWKRVCGVSTEHCVRHYRSSCSGGSTAWTGTAVYSSVYEIQTESDEQDLNVKDVFEVKYTGQTDYINVLDLDATEQARIGFDRVENGEYYFTNTAEAAIKDSIAVRHVVTLEDGDGNVYECPTDIYRHVFVSGPPPYNGNGIFGHNDTLCCFNFGPGDKRYLLAHGDDVADCTEAVEYDWNESVKLESPKAIELQAGVAKVAVSKGGDLERAELSAGSDCYIHVDLDDGDRDIVMRASSYMVYGSHCHYNSTNLFKFYSEGSITLESDAYPLNLKSLASDVKINAPAGKETLDREIDDTSDPKQITNKEYVDAADDQLREDLEELGGHCSTASGIATAVPSSNSISIRNRPVHDEYPDDKRTEVNLPTALGAEDHVQPETLSINGDIYEVVGPIFSTDDLVSYTIDGHHADKYVGINVDVTVCDPSPFVYETDFQADQDRQDAELQAEIDARVERDALHDAEIDTLEYKLDALLGLTFRGTYTFKHEADCDAIYQQCVAECFENDPDDVACRTLCGENLVNCEKDKVRPGFFEAVDPDDQFDHLEQIVISKNDASGVEIDWAGVLDAGDYLEVDHVLAGQLDKTNYGLYRITEEPELTANDWGEAVYIMKLQFLQGDGVMNEGENYEIRGITAAEGVNPEELGDFLTKDQAAATYLPLTGGTLTGTLNMKDAAAVKTRHLDSGNNSNLAIKRNGETKITVGSDSVIFNKIPSCSTNPTQNDHLCRKKWIDDNKAGKSHTHSGYASSSHNHDSSYVKGNYTITKSGNLYLIS